VGRGSRISGAAAAAQDAPPSPSFSRGGASTNAVGGISLKNVDVVFGDEQMVPTPGRAPRGPMGGEGHRPMVATAASAGGVGGGGRLSPAPPSPTRSGGWVESDDAPPPAP